MKRVLLVVVDGCSARLFGPALRAGELPTLAALAAAGSLELDCVSIFPSITPAATTSIVTGCHPDEHGIIGMSWWDPSTGKVSYFGSSVSTVLQRGIGAFVHDFLVTLNERIAAPTLYQLAERHGRTAGCFNYLIFRGDTTHDITPPLLLRLLPSVDAHVRLRGPSTLALGDLVSHTPGATGGDGNGGILNRFGLDDEGTERVLRRYPSASALPDLSVAYFPDYDFDSHERGPDDARPTLQRVDRRLRAIFDGWGGYEKVLDDACVVLTADHAHSVVDRTAGAGIPVRELLDAYRLADPVSGWERDGRALLVCPNMRALEIYLGAAHADRGHEVAAALLRDPRVDQVIRRDAGGADAAIVVSTRDRGELRFRAGGGGSDVVRDAYGGQWATEGDLATIDAQAERRGPLRYGVYPNALERIATGVGADRAGRLWATARPGYEFEMDSQQVHRSAGSHGTLHELDSLVPLLVAGHPRPRLGPAPRLVDVAPLCADLLGIPFPRRRPATR